MARTGIGADVWRLAAENLPGDWAVHGGEGTTDCALTAAPGAKPDLLPGPRAELTMNPLTLDPPDWLSID